jgi:phenylacetate-CoA ligase
VPLWSVLAGAAPRYLALRRSQYWDEAALRRYQHDALKKTLAAAAKIPFYRQRFGGSPRIEDFGKLPRLRRMEVGALNQSARELHRGDESKFTAGRSSGSTGMRAEFLFDRSHQIGRYAARTRYLFESGWNPARRNVWLVFYGPYMEPDDARLVRRGTLLRTRFVKPSTDFVRLTEQLCDLDPVCIYTYPEYLEEILKVLDRTGKRFRSLATVLSGSEVLDDAVRARTLALLGVEIADNYGSTEGFIAWQCAAGSYHINAEHLMVEILNDAGEPVAPGEMGRVVMTTLENHVMPLVRYEIGDYAIASKNGCACGRTLPTIARILGRSINMFRFGDGRIVSPFDLVEVLRDRKDLRQFQIVQETEHRYALNFVAEAPLSAKAQEEIRSDFSRVLATEADLSFNQVAEIPRTAGGKFMTAISRVAPSS